MIGGALKEGPLEPWSPQGYLKICGGSPAGVLKFEFFFLMNSDLVERYY